LKLQVWEYYDINSIVSITCHSFHIISRFWHLRCWNNKRYGWLAGE